jgi:hypothetical protein
MVKDYLYFCFSSRNSSIETYIVFINAFDTDNGFFHLGYPKTMKIHVIGIAAAVTFSEAISTATGEYRISYQILNFSRT